MGCCNMQAADSEALKRAIEEPGRLPPKSSCCGRSKSCPTKRLPTSRTSRWESVMFAAGALPANDFKSYWVQRTVQEQKNACTAQAAPEPPLSPLADRGALEPELEAQARTHLEGCPTCSIQLQSLQSLSKDVKAAAPALRYTAPGPACWNECGRRRSPASAGRGGG